MWLGDQKVVVRHIHKLCRALSEAGSLPSTLSSWTVEAELGTAWQPSGESKPDRLTSPSAFIPALGLSPLLGLNVLQTAALLRVWFLPERHMSDGVGILTSAPAFCLSSLWHLSSARPYFGFTNFISLLSHLQRPSSITWSETIQIQGGVCVRVHASACLSRFCRTLFWTQLLLEQLLKD